MDTLLQKIAQCRECIANLPLGPRPVVAAHPQSKIVIIGQAPGLAVHKSGIPWDDKSGDNLRHWMQIDQATFYDPKQIAIIPMGFCYPGRGKSGDLPPRKECAPLWHQSLLDQMNSVKLILLIGKYAQDYYLGNKTERTLTETVRQFHNYLPDHFVLPHPSPRNNIWQAKNPWFGELVLPELRKHVRQIIRD
ncbi:MAG: uracil-DNA glycosylase family protein [Bacteroidetes bacterium]|nr:MAG: uracil-DNA glycosylase family protein [Bacteroidota bacterium]